MPRTEKEWQDRERELLETANRYLERARAADQTLNAIRWLIKCNTTTNGLLNFLNKRVKHV